VNGDESSPSPGPIETEEGEYDFGFGRPAPKVTPASPISASVVSEGVFGLASPNEQEIMARVIRVLADKMGGRVELNYMEVVYILQSGDKPVPHIEREDSPMGSRLTLHIEYDR
jgi:hypothetical protein